MVRMTDEAGQALLVGIVRWMRRTESKMGRVNQGAVPLLLILGVSSMQRTVKI